MATENAPGARRLVDRPIQDVILEEDALRSAEMHIRDAKGVLDTFEPTRKHAQMVEDLADAIAKKAEPLRKRIRQAREEARTR